jgi:hypothetical protein
MIIGSGANTQISQAGVFLVGAAMAKLQSLDALFRG